MPDTTYPDLEWFLSAIEDAAEIQHREDGTVKFVFFDDSATTISKARYDELFAQAERL